VSLLILVIWPPKVENSKFMTKREDKELDSTSYRKTFKALPFIERGKV